jgi:hypothetical protein
MFSSEKENLTSFTVLKYEVLYFTSSIACRSCEIVMDPNQLCLRAEILQYKGVEWSAVSDHEPGSSKSGSSDTALGGRPTDQNR